MSLNAANIQESAGGRLEPRGYGGSNPVKVAKIGLSALDAAGGLLAWANPEGVPIIVDRIQANVQTATAGAQTASFGTAANGTTLSSNFISGTSLNSTGLKETVSAGQLVPATGFVTGSTASGAAAGLAGFAYIHYHVA